MQALKIQFRFGAPIQMDSEYPIHLDALIAASVAREAEALGDADPWRMADDLSPYLGKTEGDAWVWKASALQFEAVKRTDALFDGHNTVRRSDPERYYDDFKAGLWQASRAGAAPTINTQSGPLRGYQWLSRAKWMAGATAWAVGDAEAVSEALGRISYVGKSGRNGFGRVVDVRVTPASDDERDNWMLRWLPDGMQGKPGVQYATVQACLRAPYWRKTARVLAAEPIVL